MTRTPVFSRAWTIFLLTSRLLVPAAVGALSFSAQAQNLLEPHGKVVFERLSVEEGLSQGTVRCMLQDNDGFLWVGTEDGLNKYDGYTFSHYHHHLNDPRSISDNTINALLLTADGALWIGTNDGLNRFDPVTEHFGHFRHDPANDGSLSDNRVYSLLEGVDGALWVGTFNGLNRLDRATGRFRRYQHGLGERGMPEYESVTALGLEPSQHGNTLLVGTWGSGLLRFDPRGGRFERIFSDLAPRSEQERSWVNQIYTTREGEVLVADGNLSTYDPVNRQLRHHWPRRDADDDRGVQSILKTSDGSLYAGLQHDLGLVKLDASFRFVRGFSNDVHDATSLSQGWVFCLFEDRGGVIWIGTGDGLSKLIPSQQRFLNYAPDPAIANSLSGGQVTAVLVTKTGAVWIGTRRDGITVVDKAHGKVTYYRGQPGRKGALNTDEIISLAEDSRGHIWVGTWGGGLNLFDPKAGAFRAYRMNPTKPASVPDDFIGAICESRRGELWIGTPNGVGVLNLDSIEAGQFRVFRHRPGDSTSLGDRRADAIFEDSRGAIWIGTWSGGLSRFDRESGRFTQFRHEPYDSTTLSSNKVLCFAEDRKGNLWIGTWGGGLDRYDRSHNRFIHFTEDSGLPNAQVVSIVEDWKDRLWVATNNGLSRFDADRRGFRNFDLRDGLPGYRYGHEAMAADARSGEIWVGGRIGVTMFHPDSIEGPAKPPPVTLTAIHITRLSEGQSRTIALTGSSAIDSLILTASDNIVSIEFAALDFRNPKKNEYAWKLEGFQESWVPIGTRRELTFTDLSPGTYMLYLRGANSDGVWSTLGRVLTITVLPPWWRTTIAYLLYICVFLSLILLFIGGMRRRIMRKERAQLDLLESELRFQTIAAQSRALQSENERKELELQKAEELRSAYQALEDAHEFLKSAQTRLSGILALASDAFISVDGNQLITLFNSTAEQVFGYSEAELLGKPLQQLLPDAFVSEQVKLAAAEHADEASRRIAENLRLWGRRKNGETFHAEASISRLELAGEVIFTVMLRDITRRLRTQEQLEQLSRAVEQSPGIVIITNTAGDIEYVNPKFTEVSGYTFEEIAGRNPRLLKSEFTQKTVYVDMWQTLRSGKEWRGELRNQRKDGSAYWVSSSVSSIKNSDGEVTHYIGIQEDITSRKETEEKLLQHTEDLEMINRIVKTVNREFDLMRLIRMLLEQGMALLPWADSGAVLIREEPEKPFRLVDVIGMDRDASWEEISEEDIAEGLLSGASAIKEGLYIVEGQSTPQEDEKCGLGGLYTLLALEVHWTGVEQELQHASYIVFGSHAENTRITGKDVVRISHFREHAVSALAKASAMRVLQDKNNELLRTQEQLIMQQKMASLGQLTAGIAHEIRNPLNFVNNFAISAIELIAEIQEATAKGEETHEMFEDLRLASERILDHGKRANSIVDSMLLHARRNTGIRQSMNINAMLEEAANLAYHGMRARVSDFTVNIVRQFDDNVPELHGVQQDISRVFLNLLNNALFAVREKKEVQPSGSPFVPEVVVRSTADDRYVEVRISDNGMGISPEAVDQIFQPFYTTKTSGEGTGLGLSLSYDIIVNGYGGELFVDQDYKDGAAFVIRLPIRGSAHPS
ncbi:MAG: PAS domain S-box protein [Bacteroidetes bacterium]|nr:PAS domain S-box protein [Bacteroidota bacterium]